MIASPCNNISDFEKTESRIEQVMKNNKLFFVLFRSKICFANFIPSEVEGLNLRQAQVKINCKQFILEFDPSSG